MIPSNIKKDHILQAISGIDFEGIPPGRRSRGYLLVVDGKPYPPKYIISLANSFANGEELDPDTFSGGKETNDFLERLGFQIARTTKAKIAELGKKHRKLIRGKEIKRHTERCPECKIIVERMLKKLYSEVETNFDLGVGAALEDFEGLPCYHSLEAIYSALQNHRGHKNFVRGKKLPRCDFYLPEPSFIVEFDESQHFSRPRMISLENYPRDLNLGFLLHRWIGLCENISSQDNDPVFRDEQRAWYDTLRDFLPLIKDLSPTVRLFSRDFFWCNLDPENNFDVRKFEALLCGSGILIEIRSDPDPTLARIVIAGEWDGDVQAAREVLHEICEKWPAGKQVDFLITCGGFLTFKWPQNLPQDGEHIDRLIEEGENYCANLLDDRLIDKLSKFTKYLTLGVDSFKDKVSYADVDINEPHVELVSVFDLHSKKYHWTGKSYPTSGQEDGLIKVRDLKSHFLSLPPGKIMVLGCHDLNVFNLRGKKVTKKAWRKRIRKSFYDLVKTEKPEIVLHHPHTTDSPRIWASAWNELAKISPSIRSYVGAGRYFSDEGVRAPLDKVLDKTKLGNTIDFIVYS